LALDYLLAWEGGVCGKFNLSNCSLQIDDDGKVTEEITGRIKKSLPMYLCRPGRDGVPVTCSGAGSLPYVGSRP
jgi:hypothetical protein